jgi:CHAT domain-containing protein/tetratricopeptide (TPR) repeat protein
VDAWRQPVVKNLKTRTLHAMGAVWLTAFVALTMPENVRTAQAVDARAQTVRALIEEGRFADAEAAALRLVPAFDENTIKTSADTDVCDVLVEALLRNGRGAEVRTRQIAEQVVHARATQFKTDAGAIATSLRNLGDVLFESGEYQLATSLFTHALAAREQTPGGEPGDIAEDLDHLVRALTEIDRYDDALRLSDRALALREQFPSSAGVSLARTLQVRGVLEKRRGNYQKSHVDLERAWALREAANPLHPDSAIALAHFGEQLTLEGDLNRSRELLGRAVEMASSALRPNHPDITFPLRNLAITLAEFGDLAGSQELRQRALKISEASLGSNHPLVALQLNDLGIAYYFQGSYATARDLYEQALAIYVRRLGPDHVATLTTRFNLALLQSKLGDLHDARQELERLTVTWERVAGRDHANVARPLSALAELLAAQGFDSEARPYFERALSIRERALDPEHPLVASTLSELAACVARLGDLKQASELSARALRIRELAGAPRHLADALGSRAHILATAGDYRGAAQLYRRTLELRLPLLGVSHPSVAETEVAYSLVQARLNEPRDALDRALRGEDISRHHSRLTLGSLSERQALDYAASRPRGLDLALSLMSSVEDHTRALDALILGRSLTLDEIGARHRVPVDGESALIPLWAALASTRQRLANLVIRGPNDRRPGQYAALVAEARRAKEHAERQLAEQSAAFGSELKKTEIDLEQVRATLPTGSGLVSIVRFNRTMFDQAPAVGAASRPLAKSASRTIPSYVAFVLRPGTDSPTVVPLGRADTLEALIAQWRRELIASMQPSATASETERLFRERGANLRRRLWDPIEAHLDGVRRVFVVPDGAVNLVPLAALPVAGSRYLLEEGPVIHYLSAERDLVPPERPFAEPRRGLLAVGGPAFADGSVFASLSGTRPPNRTGVQTGTAAAAPSIPSAATAASGSFRSAGSNCPGFQSIRFPALPGSGREAEDVGSLWRTHRPGNAGGQSAEDQVLIGRSASEQAIKQLAPGTRILHFATHGFFMGGECASALDDTRAVGGLVASGRPRTVAPKKARSAPLPENPLLLSGLAMAGANRRASAGPDEDDGILTAEEVASLNLQGTEWAVLSACGTGLGEIKAGEGVLGLRRAFQIAGARTVIMSLWSVDDRATRTWMRALYEGRLSKGLNTADAVREASLTVLRDRRARHQTTHPFYWAAFVAAGDWR